MAVFIVSLFLPSTINFNVQQAPSSLPDVPEKRPSVAERRSLSLFNKPAAIPPLIQTPGATTDHERIFIVSEQEPFNLSLPSANQDPRSIAPADLHSPTWGKAFNWKQPTSRAKSPPPSSVLRHKSTRERTASMLWSAQSKYKAQERARQVSHERRFSQSGFSVDQAQMGNGGLRNAIKAASDAGLLEEKTWVGTLGMPTDALDQHVKSSIAEKLENDHESLTVFCDDSDFDGHYSHYCKTILWPVLHYQVPDNPKSKAYEDHSWVYYVKVNQAFADRIAKNWKKGDIVWIHDYHLLLVPGMLRKVIPEAQIGFFLHVAFPSSEIFRCLAVRSELLDGILGANLVGFQTDEYCHHFLQTCSRLLCVEATKHGVHLEDGRFVHVDTFPIGIDPKSLDARRELQEVSDWAKIISEKYQGKRIIVARDKLDSIRGVRQKILSYELFLNKNPEYRDQVVLIQIATSTNQQTELDATVSDIVTRVNSTHSTLAHQPLVFLKQDISYSQYLALLTVAECLMITSLREGMNLTSHEFVYCQDGKHGSTQYSPLILSEFTGSASVLDNHRLLLINPWDYKETADAIKTALDMTSQERKIQWHSLYGNVMHHTAIHWYENYMHALEAAYNEQSLRHTTAVPRLSYTAIAPKYEKASNGRLLILDYEGTLVSWGSPSDIILTTPKRAVDVLNDLIDDERNTVYVMSSRMPEEMERLFRQVPNLGMIAENGCFLMEAGKDTPDDWIELTDSEHNSDWKNGVRNILEYYRERIEGSKVEELHCSLVFDYNEAEDAAAAQKQASECANHINDSCQKQHIHAVPSDGKLIISNAEVNKASAATLISDRLKKLRDDKGKPMPDFLMVIGDGREDEYVFNWAHRLENKCIRDVVTVTLGSRNTEASATLTQGVTGVLSILQKLAGLYSEYRGTQGYDVLR